MTGRLATAGPRMYALRGLAIAIAACSVVTGCNVVQMQRASLVGGLQSRGLSAADAQLGDDTVHYFYREGEGTPVVFLHGFGSPAPFQWAEQVAVFEGRPILMPDLLWFGASRSGRAHYSLDDQVRAVSALMARLELGPADLVGTSYGGLVALELATQEPSRVRRLVLIDSPGRAFTDADQQALLRRFGVSHIGDVMVPETAAGVRGLLALAYASPPFVPDVVLWQVQAEFYGDTRRPHLRALLDALDRDRAALRARPDPEAPTLLVWGRDDPVFPLEVAERLRERLDAELLVIDHARHAPQLEHPHAVNDALLPFLAD